MTDYNDGEWHGWNGGECPVHPGTIVEVAFKGPRDSLEGAARGVEWGFLSDLPGRDLVVALRVLKEHRDPPKPREWEASISPDGGLEG